MNNIAFLFIGMALFGLASLANKKEKSLLKNVSTVVFVAVMSAWPLIFPLIGILLRMEWFRLFLLRRCAERFTFFIIKKTATIKNC